MENENSPLHCVLNFLRSSDGFMIPSRTRCTALDDLISDLLKQRLTIRSRPRDRRASCAQCLYPARDSWVRQHTCFSERVVAQIVNMALTTHTLVVEKIIKDSQSHAASCERTGCKDCQDTILQRLRKQVVNKHVQQVVNSVEVKQSKIIKNTVQRKNPIIHEKIKQVEFLKTVPRPKPGSDNDQTSKDQSVCQTRRDA